MNRNQIIGITGVNGFIGGNFAKNLSKKYTLVLFGKRKSFDIPNSKWILKDLNNCKTKDFQKIDVLIHLAGSNTNIDAFQKNYILTKKILNSAINAKVKKIYFVSTYAVYGNRKTPADIHSKLAPSDDYAYSKMIAENLVQKAFQKKEIGGSILRFCSAYGGGIGLVDLIKNKINNNEKITLRGLFFRQYLHISDLYDLFLKILELKNPEKIYNLEGEKTNILDIKKILDQGNIKNNIIKTKKVSYLSKGLSSKRNMTIKKYLINK